jgi:hypothetical protein
VRLLSLLVALAFTACAATPDVIRKSSAPLAPAWRDATPNNPMYVYFVGAKSGARSLEEGKAAATSSALSATAQYIGVNVTALTQVVDSTRAADNSVSSDTGLSANSQIQGAEVADTYWEATIRPLGATEVGRYEVWVLMRFPRAAAEAERARQEKATRDNAANALSLYKQAQAAKAAKNAAEALRLLKLASKALALLSKPVDLKGAEFRTSTELSDAVAHARSAALGDTRRAFIVSSESFLGRPSNDTIAGDRIAAGLASKGFPAEQVVSSNSGRVADAGSAALLVQVNASVVRSATLYGQSVCVAQVKAQVISTASQEILAEVDKDAKAVKANEQLAAREALVIAGNEVVQELVKALQKREGEQ